MPLRTAVTTSTTRTEAFSDGVFAIAITILVLEIHVPTAADVRTAHGLLPALLKGWPTYLSYLATFLTIGNLWLGHHILFEKIRAVDRTTQWLNLLLLLGVSFIPFPNAVVAEYLAKAPFSADSRTATAVYAGVAVCCVIPWVFFWRHLARRPELLAVGYTARYARKESTRPLIGAASYAVCLLVALVAPLGAVVLFIAVAVFFAVTVNGWSPEEEAG